MTAKIFEFPLPKPAEYQFTYTVSFRNGTRIRGKSTHSSSVDLINDLLEQNPEALNISVIKEKE